MHKIYIAATMNYGLSSDDPEELAYYNKIRKEMDDMKKQPIKKGIPLNWDSTDGMDKWTWIIFFIDGRLMLIGLPLLMILKVKNWSKLLYILPLFKFICWSFIRKWEYLKPYIFISRVGCLTS